MISSNPSGVVEMVKAIAKRELRLLCPELENRLHEMRGHYENDFEQKFDSAAGADR